MYGFIRCYLFIPLMGDGNKYWSSDDICEVDDLKRVSATKMRWRWLHVSYTERWITMFPAIQAYLTSHVLFYLVNVKLQCMRKRRRASCPLISFSSSWLIYMHILISYWALVVDSNCKVHIIP